MEKGRNFNYFLKSMHLTSNNIEYVILVLYSHIDQTDSDIVEKKVKYIFLICIVFRVTFRAYGYHGNKLK